MDDLISRQDLLDAIDTYDKFGYTETGCFVRNPKNDYVPYVHYEDMVYAIKNMPSASCPYFDGYMCRRVICQSFSRG